MFKILFKYYDDGKDYTYNLNHYCMSVKYNFIIFSLLYQSICRKNNWFQFFSESYKIGIEPYRYPFILFILIFNLKFVEINKEYRHSIPIYKNRTPISTVFLFEWKKKTTTLSAAEKKNMLFFRLCAHHLDARLVSLALSCGSVRIIHKWYSFQAHIARRFASSIR